MMDISREVEITLNSDDFSHNMCRTCLGRIELIPVFSTCTVKNEKVKIDWLLKECAQLEVSQDDILPKNICVCCLDKLMKIYIYRQEWKIVDSVLKLFLNSPSDDDLNHSTEEAKADEIVSQQKLIPTSSSHMENDKNESSSKSPKDIDYEDALSVYISSIDSKNYDSGLTHLEWKTKNEDFQNESPVFASIKISRSGDTVTELFCNAEESNENRNQPDVDASEKEVLEEDGCDTGCIAVSKLLDSEAPVKNSITKIHDEQPTTISYECKHCLEVFDTLQDLKSHRKEAKHPRGFMYPCEVCGKQFSVRKLGEHMRTHTKEKPYKCEVCQQAFSLSGNLRRHMLIHTEDRPYVCEKCGKGSPHYSTIITKSEFKS